MEFSIRPIAFFVAAFMSGGVQAFPGEFIDSGQDLGAGQSGVALGDLDGDRDLDAFFTTSTDQNTGANLVFFNNGSGMFIRDASQLLGANPSTDVALGDLNGDRDLDAFVVNNSPAGGVGWPNRVWFNDSVGVFADSGQSLSNLQSMDVQ